MGSGARRRGFPVISFQKNSTEEIYVRLREFKGERYLILRAFYEGGGGKMRPSKKGFAVRLELSEALIDAIREVAEQDRLDD